MNRRIVLSVMSVLLLATALSTPVAAAPPEPYQISMLIGTLDNPYWITMI